MFDETPPSSPRHDAVALPQHELEWQPILHSSNQVVLYNPTSHSLSIRRSSRRHNRQQPSCPYCKQTLPEGFEPDLGAEGDQYEVLDSDPAYHSRTNDYFHLLAIANQTNSRPPSPPPRVNGEGSRRGTFPAEVMAEGYFKAFFQEEYRLGMGANGSVYLCQHMLDGNALGHFAVKKIAVGESHSYLLKILREVRLLERLHHPNIVTYHHAWLETCQFSAFGPKVPTLHVLMQWAEGGSLDDFIDIRLGRKTQHIHINQVAPFSDEDPHIDSFSTPGPNTSTDVPQSHPASAEHSRSARIRAFRARQSATPEERERQRREMQAARGQQTWTAVHLLSAAEVKSLFSDVVEGLSFLHNKSILHLDLKPGNVLLTWDDGKLIPRAMLSDFGTSRDMVHNSPARSGNTGTLEYASPESLPSPITGLLQQVDSKADMWSLGMILHKLLFFKLPYRYAASGDANGETLSHDREDTKLDQLEKEVLNYPGFKSNSTLLDTFEARRLPQTFLVLLESLLNVSPVKRPPCERISTAIRRGKLDPLKDTPNARDNHTSLIAVPRRTTPDSPTPTLTTPNGQSGELQAGTGPMIEVLPTPLSSEDDRIRYGDVDDDDGDVFIGTGASETTRLLGGPAVSSSTSSRVGDVIWKRWPSQSWFSPWLMKIPQRREGTGMLRRRVLKSSVLVAKVVNLTTLCPSTRPHGIVLLVVIAAAILDTLFESLWVCLWLVTLHVLLVNGGCLGGVCCI